MFYNYFNNIQLIFLILALTLFFVSLIFFVKEKGTFALIFLLLAGFSIFCFSAVLDPFLNLWDERFHALVAKNLMQHPLMPTLYDNPAINIAYDRWDRYYIWLHKQPLFLWQIALSFKLFGVSEFTLRLPSVILGTVLVFTGYRTGKLLLNKRVGYITGILITTSFFLIELIAGRQELDHNDIAFLGYISLSLWAFIEYIYSKNNKWIYLIGLFSGFAILCKWLPGLLVYLVWCFYLFLKKQYNIKSFFPLFVSLLITIIIVLPWQILCYYWYPAEFVSALKYNTLHFYIPVEGHRGSFNFYFNKFDIIYGKYALYLIIPAFIIFIKKTNNSLLALSLILVVFFIYLFFSVAATKMISYPLITALIILISFATLFDSCLLFLEKFLKSKGLSKFLFAFIILLFVLFRFDLNGIIDKHSLQKQENTYSQMLLHNKNIFLKQKLPANTVIFNVKGRHYIEYMFYTGLPSYNLIPSFEQFQELKSKNKIVVLFKPPGFNIPDYLTNENIIVINAELQGYD